MKTLLSPFFYFACVSLLALSCSAIGLSADLPESFRVDRVKIEGSHFLKKKEVLSVVDVQPPSPWRFWRKRPVASEEDLSDDAYRISQFYRSSGFYHAVVTFEVDIPHGSSGQNAAAQVTYVIDEGTPVTVESIQIDFAGTETPLPKESLRDSIPLKTGMRFEEKAYRESKKQILKRFGSIGYPLAAVAGKALIYPSTDRARVTFTVTPGRRCFFGETTLAGDTPIVNEKILERSRTYLPNELYNTLKVEKSQRNLYNLDLFKAAVIQPGEPDPDTGKVPMRLELKMKKRNSIKLGVGYGDEDGIRLRAGWTYRNLFGWAGKLNVEAKRTDLQKKASVGYSQPYFWDSRSALQTEAGVLQEFLDSYESQKLFSTIRFTRDMGRHLNLTAAYLLEYSDLRNLNLSDPGEQAAFREDHTFFISSVFWEMIRNTADSDTNPKHGSTISGSIEIASTILGSELTYIHPSLEFKKYLELPLGTVLAGRLKLETISDPEKNQDIPVFKRLFLGGANTVRGYAYQKLGPMDATGNPKGGLTALLANIELRRPIVGVLSGVLFLDTGMVDEEKFHFSKAAVRYSAGAGLRLDTPVGPLRLEIGYKLNPPNISEGNGETAAVPTDRWRIHFNIGHAF